MKGFPSSFAECKTHIVNSSKETPQNILSIFNSLDILSQFVCMSVLKSVHGGQKKNLLALCM
jgi:hypothetical protein